MSVFPTNFEPFDSITDLLVFDLKVEVSAEPVVEEGLLNITGGLQLK